MSTKEEQKQHLIDIMKGDEELGLYEHGQKVGHSVQVEETLEEAARQWGKVHRTPYLGFIEGAKWQQERSYSAEEVIQLVSDWNTFDYHQDSFSGKDDLTFKEWFEQFKKK